MNFILKYWIEILASVIIGALLTCSYISKMNKFRDDIVTMELNRFDKHEQVGITTVEENRSGALILLSCGGKPKECE